MAVICGEGKTLFSREKRVFPSPQITAMRRFITLIINNFYCKRACIFNLYVAKLLLLFAGVSFLVALISVLGMLEQGFLLPAIFSAVVCLCIGLQVKAQGQFHLSICQINFNLQKIVDHLEE